MPRERERKRVKESSAMCSRISVFQMSICFRAHGCWLDDGDDTGASNVKPWLSCGTCAFARFECHIICEVKATMYLCVFHTIFPFDMKSGGNARACATAPVENLKQFFSLRCCCYRCWFAWLRPNKRIHSQLMFHNNIFQNLVWINGFVWRTRQRTTPARSSSARHTTMMGCEWQICVTLAQLWIVCECMHLTAIFCVFFHFFSNRADNIGWGKTNISFGIMSSVLIIALVMNVLFVDVGNQECLTIFTHEAQAIRIKTISPDAIHGFIVHELYGNLVSFAHFVAQQMLCFSFVTAHTHSTHSTHSFTRPWYEKIAQPTDGPLCSISWV